MEEEKHTFLVSIPIGTKDVLIAAAEKDGRKLKPYVELVLVKHAERKNKKK